MTMFSQVISNKSEGVMFQRKSIFFLLTLSAAILACNLPVQLGANTPSPLDTFVVMTEAATSAVILDATPPPPAALPTETPIPPTIAPAPTATPIPPTSVPTEAQTTRAAASVAATYLGDPPTVDGNLTDWGLPMYAINGIWFGTAFWGGVNDASGMLMIGWDEANLYVAFQVTDDVYAQSASGRRLFEGDSVEILLDTKLTEDFYTNQLSPDDYQLGISPGLQTIGASPQAYLWFPKSIEGTRADVTLGVLQTDTGYNVEAQIPWSVFSMTPVAGRHYGFCASISDNDKIGSAVQQSLVSNVQDRHLTQPTTWGDLVLMK
jgi:hypothetical protein